MGLVEGAAEYFPDARWQRCMVHFYRNVFSHVPAGKLREVALMLKAIHAQEDLPAAQRKAAEIVARLRDMRLGKAADLVDAAVPRPWPTTPSPKNTGGVSGPRMRSTSAFVFGVVFFSGAGDLVAKRGVTAGSAARCLIPALPD